MRYMCEIRLSKEDETKRLNELIDKYNREHPNTIDGVPSNSCSTPGFFTICCWQYALWEAIIKSQSYPLFPTIYNTQNKEV